MKILFVCHRLITFILNEIIELEKLGNDVTILSLHRDRKIFNKIVLPMLDENGIREKTFVDFTPRKNRAMLLHQLIVVIARNFMKFPSKTIHSLYLLHKIFRMKRDGINCYLETSPLIKMRFDIIHCPFSTLNSLFRVSYLSQLLNVPYTLSFRAHDLHAVDNFKKSLAQKNIILNAARVFTISQYNKSILLKNLALGNTVEVIHGAVDVNFFKPVRSIKENNRIIAVCRFHKQKGIIDLLKACNILHERKVPYKCYLIGEGPEEENYQQFISKHNLPDIIIINFLDREGVREELAKSELFVLPCVVLKDGTCDILPNSLKEAMAMAIPVITSDISGIRELVDDKKSGRLVPSEDPVAIADAIELLLADKALMKSMGEAGRQKILMDFNIKTEAVKINHIFSSSVESIHKAEPISTYR